MEEQTGFWSVRKDLTCSFSDILRETLKTESRSGVWLVNEKHLKNNGILPINS